MPVQHVPVIVSITTLPSRIEHIRPTLESLLQGELKPDRILLAIPKFSVRENCEYKLPDFLRDPLFCSGIIEVVVPSTDWGPGTKYLGALDHIPAKCYLVVADDDVFYKPQFLRLLVEAQKKDHRSSFSHFTYRAKGLRVGQGVDGFSSWAPNLTGLQEFADRHVAGTRLKFHDDLWVAFYLAMRGIKVKKVSYAADGDLIYDQLLPNILSVQTGNLDRGVIVKDELERLYKNGGMSTFKVAKLQALWGLDELRRIYATLSRRLRRSDVDAGLNE